MMYRLVAAFALLAIPALAQPFPNAPAGQTAGGINANTFANNTDSVGFNETSLSSNVVGTGTTQATSTLLITRTSVVTSCPAGAGVVLPSVNRYVGVVVLNRSGGTCLIYPSPGATVETVPGTAGAVNAPATMATNTDTIFRPIGGTAWAQ